MTRTVDIWVAPLDVPLTGFGWLVASLSRAERARAERYRLARHARRFSAGRGWLRYVLGAELGLAPDAVPLADDGVRPRLLGDEGLHVSISHAGELAVIAVSSRPVGVDVEPLHHLQPDPGVARLACTQAEWEELDRLAPDQQAVAFLRAWTAKEAFLKASGSGLDVRPSTIEVGVSRASVGTWVRRTGGEDLHRWWVRDLRAADGYVAAVAAEGQDWELRPRSTAELTLGPRAVDGPGLAPHSAAAALGRPAEPGGDTCASPSGAAGGGIGEPALAGQPDGSRAVLAAIVAPAPPDQFAASRAGPRPMPALATPPGATEHEDAVVCKGLTKVYRGGIRAVDDLDLQVRRGEIFGLLGPNGAGKTTTVGMLTTRVVPTAGSGLVGGVDVVAEPARAKQLIGVVAQGNTLDRSLTVWDNLFFHGRYFGMRARAARLAADAALERFRLTGRATSEVEALSGGMARRLMVARAVLHGPAVLFLDEPTAGLDPQSRLALWDIIGELHAAGQTILLTTHYMEEADRFCDRLAIVDHGRIVALDTPAGLKRALGGGVDVTIRAEGDTAALAGHLAGLAGASAIREYQGEVTLHLDEAGTALSRVTSAAEAAGFKLTELSVAEATLESIFIRLTGEELRE